MKRRGFIVGLLGAGTLLTLPNKKQNKVISQKPCLNSRYEKFTHTPLMAVFMVDRVYSRGNILLRDSKGLTIYQIVVNTKNCTTARIDKIQGKRIKITSLGNGDKKFKCYKDDVLLTTAPHI